MVPLPTSFARGEDESSSTPILSVAKRWGGGPFAVASAKANGGGAAQPNKAVSDGMSVRHHLRCGNSQNPQAQSTHVLVASSIAFNREIVNLAVDLDDELGRGTIEVGDIRPNGMLAAKAHATGGTPQQRPKPYLRRGHVPPLLLRVPH